MRSVEIDVLELLVSVVGIVACRNWLKNKSISIYNDNPTAAGALKTKAPPLYRLDLQFLVLKLATITAESKLYFWGIHYTVKDGEPMVLADQLSRLNKAADKVFQNIPCVNVIDIVNTLLKELMRTPLNLPSKCDFTRERRVQYGILLNDDRVYNEPYFVKHAKNKPYSILDRCIM